MNTKSFFRNVGYGLLLVSIGISLSPHSSLLSYLAGYLSALGASLIIIPSLYEWLDKWKKERTQPPEAK